MTFPRLTVEDAIAASAAKPVGKDRWIGKCPAHGDTGMSLAISRGTKGQELMMHCFSGGCSFMDLVNAVAARAFGVTK